MSPRQISNSIPEPLNASEVLSGLYLAESGNLTDLRSADFALQARGEMRLYYVAGGKGTMRMAGRAHAVQQNDVFFQPRAESLEISATPSCPMEIWWVDFYGAALSRLLGELAICTAAPVLTGIYEPRFFQELKALVTDYDSLSNADKLHLTSGLYKIFALLLDAGQNSHWVTVRFDNPAILYTGDWRHWPSPVTGAARNEESYTSMPRAYAEFNFYGSGIKWYGTVNFDCGKADVIIDGNHVTSVDTYSPARLSRQLLYANSKLSYGHHIIKIFCSGARNDKAINCDIAVESFQYLAAAEPQGAIEPAGRFSQLVRRAVSLIDSGLREINVEEVARRLGVNRSHLSVRFSAEMGMSPSQYLLQARIAAAKRILEGTDLPISKIAADIGYGDMFYFSRVFKAHEKLTPSQYRKMNRQS